MSNVLVTGSGGPLGVNVTRCLLESGRRDRLVGTDANRWHLPLSLCEQTYRIPFARSRAEYAAALQDIEVRESIDVIVPTHPVEVRAVAELKRDGVLNSKVALPNCSTLEICDDKARTQERLLAADVPVPETIVLRAPDDVDRAFALWTGERGDRVWIRGNGAPGLGIGGAALPCRDTNVGKAWVEHHRGWQHMCASEYLPGANLTWMAVFSHGSVVVSGSRERLEYVLPHVAPSGVTGAPAVSRTIDRLDVQEIGEAAVRAVDSQPHGAFFVDMKEDAKGQPRVTEINAGRCGTTVHFYARAGGNFPALLVELAEAGELEPRAEGEVFVEAGLYWVRTLDCGPELLREEGFDQYPSAGLGDD